MHLEWMRIFFSHPFRQNVSLDYFKNMYLFVVGFDYSAINWKNKLDLKLYLFQSNLKIKDNKKDRSF